MTCVSSLDFVFGGVSALEGVSLSAAPFATPLIREDDVVSGTTESFYIKFYDNQPNNGDYAVLQIFNDGGHYLFANPNDRNLESDLFCVPPSTLSF